MFWSDSTDSDSTFCNVGLSHESPLWAVHRTSSRNLRKMTIGKAIWPQRREKTANKRAEKPGWVINTRDKRLRNEMLASPPSLSVCKILLEVLNKFFGRVGNWGQNVAYNVHFAAYDLITGLTVAWWGRSLSYHLAKLSNKSCFLHTIHGACGNLAGETPDKPTIFDWMIDRLVNCCHCS